MADHSELVKEMVENEKLSSQKRLELARKRRQQQLKKYHEAEKKLEKQEKAANKRKTKTNSGLNPSSPKTSKVPKITKVGFDSGVKLLEAAARNDIKEVRELLEAGVSPDVANEDGLTALHQCCIDDSEEMLLVLLKHGATVNARDSELWTPLHAASTCGHINICQHLVERKADLLAVNADGNMPYDICEDEYTLEYLETQMANQGVTQELIDETRLSTEKTMITDIKEYEREGQTPSLWRDRVGASLLHISAANGYYDVTSYLLTKRIDVNCIDNDGWTPAMAAAFWAQIPVLELLAKSGADLELKTKDNKTLLDLVDDVEIKEQIEEIKKETESNMDRFKRVNSDIRRRSSNNIRSLSAAVSSIYSSNTSLSDKNPFSTIDSPALSESPKLSSVRRHSMREKHKLSLKEARDEARYRISISTEDITTSDGQASPKSSEDSASVPVTNIDDIDMTVSDNNIVTINITASNPVTNSEEPGLNDNNQQVKHDTPPPTQTSPLQPPQQILKMMQNGEAHEEKPTKKVSATIQISDDTPPLAPSHEAEKQIIEQQETNHNNENVKPIENSSSHSPKQDEVDGKPTIKNGGKDVISASHETGDPPLKRFTALDQPAVGNDDHSSKKCCIIS